ncbi:hypothetical protein GGI15_002357 [Coemansia interrupta]|uniref:U3 small nucleolar RNA-associated protein 14 n=1 Tax=Coemansia interrupta TaxID=1126814 RepID=A0A9W8HE61_9FUNG|nr:hypothetical protein GGI15_002357 [Coemansia interrupta]
MRGGRRQSNRAPAPVRGSGQGSRAKGRKQTCDRPKPPHSSTDKGKGKGRQHAEDTLDVFDAEGSDSGPDDILRRRQLERIAVRDYEVEDVASEDDEEIESDDAFDVSDAERFGGYKFNGPGRSARAADDSEDEESSVEEDGFEDEDDENIVDLSEMLDGNASDEDEEKREQQPEGAGSPPASASASLLGFKDLAVGKGGLGGSSDESEDEGDEDGELAAMGFYSGESADEASDSDDADADADADKLAKLGGFVSAISARASKRRFVEEAGDGLIEDEHAIGSGLHTKGVSLGLGDLLGDLSDGLGSGSDDDDDAGEKQSAREMRRLKDQVTKLERAAKQAGTGVVAAPLPKRLQDQVDRKVAYKKTKAAVSEWQPAVDANRVAEHLSFPLAAPGGPAPSMTSAMLVSGPEAAKSSMEREIESILSASGMTDEQQRQYEELEMQALSKEEVQRRQRELRMTRELMFRSEQRAKRMAKIKSKAYRRILKKQRVREEDRAMEKLREEDPEMHALLVEKMAEGRAEERMTLRHKNTGKWARGLAGRSHGDDDRQTALREQMDEHDKLKRKIYDIADDEDVDDYEADRTGMHDGDVSDSDADDTFEGIRAKTLGKISAELDAAPEDVPGDAPHRALLSMKFMQNAVQRREEETRRDAEMMRDEFEALEADVDDQGRTVAVKRARAAKDTKGGVATGRMSFGGGLKKRAQMEDAAKEDGDEEGEAGGKRARLNEAGQISQVASGGGHRVTMNEAVSVGAAADAEEANPWLADDSVALGRRNGGKLRGLDKDSSKLDKLSAKLRSKRSVDGPDSVAMAGGSSGSVMLDVDNVMTSAARPGQQRGGGDDSDSDAEGIRLEHTGSIGDVKHPTTFTQRDLVQQAFAEDDVVEAEFEEEKQAAMDEDAPKTEDLTLPGWGSWGGKSLQPKKNKVVRKPAAGEGIEKSKRKDAKLGSVIINQTLPKTAQKYYSSNVPFPFYTPEQYEDTLQAPIGKEWNTAKSFGKAIKPRVMTKAGRIINPLVIPSKKKQ